MIRWRRTDEVLYDLSLDIDQGSDRLSILAVQVGQETRQIAMHMVLAGLSLKRLLIGHDELTQPVQHGAEHVGRNDAVPQYFFVPLCPHGAHLFASSPWPVDREYGLEAIDTTGGYVMQRGSKEEIQ